MTLVQWRSRYLGQYRWREYRLRYLHSKFYLVSRFVLILWSNAGEHTKWTFQALYGLSKPTQQNDITSSNPVHRMRYLSLPSTQED